MVPIIDARAIEVSLADFSPVFGRVGPRVRVFPQALGARVPKSFAQSPAPARIDGFFSGVYRMAKFMHANALVVITVHQKIEQILLAEARNVKPSGSADALVEVIPILGVSVFRHVRVELVASDNDQARAIGRHG